VREWLGVISCPVKTTARALPLWQSPAFDSR